MNSQVKRNRVIREADISACGAYRYTLTRDWTPPFTDISKGRVLFVMLNPSTADAEQDDPTIRKCVGFAQRWGYTSLDVVNLFAYRATKPRDLVDAARAGCDIVGPDNDDHIKAALGRTDLVVAAWGEGGGTFRQGPAPMRWSRVCGLVAGHGLKLKALKLTMEGHPWHPLYVSYATKLVDFDGRVRA